MKIKVCSFNGCDKPRFKKPGNNMLYFKYCIDHQIKAVLDRNKQSLIKDTNDLNNARKTSKNTAQGKFYKSAAWINCSHYVLLYYSDENLMVRCCTSPNLIYHVTDKAIHCGHYIKADQYKSTAFEFKNLAPQSYVDNVHFSGKPEIMKNWIEETHGAGTVDWLNIEKYKICKLDKYELSHISKYYINLLNLELKRRNIKNPWKK